MNERAASPTHQFVIVVGASAGGLEALGSLLEGFPEPLGAPVVIAQHLSPTHHSHLAGLLEKRSALPVYSAEDGTHLDNGRVYVVPEGRHAILRDGAIRLEIPEKDAAPCPSIDRLLTSAAAEYGVGAVAILLSGSGSDGADGAVDVHNAGGMVLAQNEETAKYHSMPAQAIDRGIADAVDSPSALARIASLNIASGPPPATSASSDELDRLIRLVDSELDFGIDHYKRTTVARRIAARMAAAEFNSIASYLEFVESDPDEPVRLVESILIPVTSFFRDREAWEALRKDLTERLKTCREEQRDFRGWSVGCCTGEEAFSLAMLIDDIQREESLDVPVQIFATDLSDTAIQHARRGVYPADRLPQIPIRMAERYVRNDGRELKIVDDLREQIVFAHHDILRSTPFQHMDVITCRNMLIYLTAEAQERTLGTFASCLDPGGVLFLGKAESAAGWETMLRKSSGTHRVFVRTNKLNDRPAGPFTFDGLERTVARYSRYRQRLRQRGRTNQERLERFVLTRGAPVALLNAEDEVLNLVGRTDGLLEIPPGPFPSSLAELLPEPLDLHFRTTLLAARRENEVRVSDAISVLHGEVEATWVMRVTPSESEPGEVYVAFEMVPASRATTTGLSIEDLDELADDSTARALAQELVETRTHLNIVIEELESANEELQTTNEELLSANEEFQVTNEELETANEELQTTNEELQTVNAELASRNQEVRELYTDLGNVLEALHDPVMVFDRGLALKFTNEAGTRFLESVGLDSGTIGLVDVNLEVAGINLARLAKEAEESETVTSERFRRGRRVFEASVSRTSDADSRPVSTVVAFHDVTEFVDVRAQLAETATALERLREQRRELLDGLPAIVALVDTDGQLLLVNKAWRESEATSALATPEAVEGSDYFAFLESEAEAGADGSREIANALRGVLDGEARRWQHDYAGRGTNASEWYQCTIQRVPFLDGVGAVVMHLDVTRRVNVERQLSQSHRLEAVGQLAGGIAHDFNNLMSVLLGNLEPLRDSIEAGEVAERELEIVDASLEAVDRGASLTAQLLQFSRRQSQSAAAFEVGGEVGRTVRLLERTLPDQYPIEVSTPDRPIWTEADPRHFGNALMNLILNSRDAMPEGGTIRLSVGTEESPDVLGTGGAELKEGSYVRISVIDEGVGISPDQLRRVVEPFFTTKDESEGSGLGLSMVYGFATHAGGGFQIESEEGSGTTATIYLPVGAQPPSFGGSPEEPPRAGSEVPSGLRILIVEDERSVRRATRRSLENFGAIVIEAVDGDQGLERFRRAPHSFDMVISDISMPGDLDGVALAREIRKESAVPIVLVSGFPDVAARETDLSDLGVHFLSKPFRRVDLEQALQQAL